MRRERLCRVPHTVTFNSRCQRELREATEACILRQLPLGVKTFEVLHSAVHDFDRESVFVVSYERPVRRGRVMRPYPAPRASRCRARLPRREGRWVLLRLEGME